MKRVFTKKIDKKHIVKESLNAVTLYAEDSNCSGSCTVKKVNNCPTTNTSSCWWYAVRKKCYFVLNWDKVLSLGSSVLWVDKNS